MPLKRILVPVDFSDASLGALDYAVELAQTAGSELTVLFVVEPVYYATPADLYGASANLSMLLEEQQRIGREQLESLGRQLKRRKVKFRTQLESGIPYQVIVERAEKLKADLIVMPSHGRTGLKRILIGSVAERVVRLAHCPVLVLRN